MLKTKLDVLKFIILLDCVRKALGTLMKGLTLREQANEH